jgi:hypothetical protein
MTLDGRMLYFARAKGFRNASKGDKFTDGLRGRKRERKWQGMKIRKESSPLNFKGIFH